MSIEPASSSAVPPSRSRIAEAASRTHTKHPRWLDKQGRSRALSTHPLYETFRAMIARCYNEFAINYEDYGGRGIRVWAPWHDCYTFIMDIVRILGDRPAGMTLDRIDNDGDYHPDNVQWQDRKAQAANRRRADAANLEERLARPSRPQRSPLVLWLHTGNRLECWACLRQDPYRPDLLAALHGDEDSPDEWCRRAAGSSFSSPLQADSWSGLLAGP